MVRSCESLTRADADIRRRILSIAEGSVHDAADAARRKIDLHFAAEILGERPGHDVRAKYAMGRSPDRRPVRFDPGNLQRSAVRSLVQAPVYFAPSVL